MATVVTNASKGAPLSISEMDANFTNLNTDKLEDAASDGSQYIRKDGSWANVTGVVTSFVETASTKPSNPTSGDVWFSETNGVSYVYSSANNAWISLGGAGRGGASTSLIGMSDVANLNGFVGQLRYSTTTSSWRANPIEAEDVTVVSSPPTPADVAQGDSTYTQYNGGTDVDFYSKTLGDSPTLVYCKIVLIVEDLPYYPTYSTTGIKAYATAQYKINNTIQRPVSHIGNTYSLVLTGLDGNLSQNINTHLPYSPEKQYQEAVFTNILTGGATLSFSKTEFRACAPEMRVQIVTRPLM